MTEICPASFILINFAYHTLHNQTNDIKWRKKTISNWIIENFNKKKNTQKNVRRNSETLRINQCSLIQQRLSARVCWWVCAFVYFSRYCNLKFSGVRERGEVLLQAGSIAFKTVQIGHRSRTKHTTNPPTASSPTLSQPPHPAGKRGEEI